MRKRAARCEGCSYHRVPSCDYNGFLGYDPATGAEMWEEGVACSRFTLSCGDGRQRWDIYLRQPGESGYRRVGSVCLTVGAKVIGMSELSAGLYRQFEQTVPPATFTVHPATDQLVNTPTIVYATGQDVASPTYTVEGIQVRLTLTPQYVWDFGDGEVVDSGSDPGRPFSGDYSETVEHAYRTAGSRTITLTATWRATFTAFGETFAVTQPVVRRQPRPVLVREARARLQDG